MDDWTADQIAHDYSCSVQHGPGTVCEWEQEINMAHIREPHVRPLADQPNKIPTRKVSAGALAGSIVTIGVALAEPFGVTIAPEVAAALVTVLTFAASYIIKDRA